MRTNFDQLRELLVLSGEPAHTGSAEQWAEAHQRLQGHFPVDYLQFVSTFGYCEIEFHLRVLNPFARNGGFWDDLERERAIDLEHFELVPPEDPRAFFPRPKGMIPWGSTDDGGSYLWVTHDADPDRWTVFKDWDLAGKDYGVGMEEFLLAGLRGQLDGFALGAGFPEALPVRLDPIVDTASS